MKERILEFIAYKGISNRAFEISCGFSNGYINSMRKGLGVNKIEDVLRVYPELNKDWLITGEGEMLRTDPGAGAVSDVEALRRRIAELEATVERQNRVIDALTGTGCKQIG